MVNKSDLEVYLKQGLAGLALLLSTLSFPAPAGAENLANALASGDAGVDFYLRYEFVDDKAFENNAYVLSLRSELNYRTQSWHNLDFFIEAVDVTSPEESKANNGGDGDLSNGVTDRPVIADPNQTVINQVYLRFRPPNTSLIGGRSEIDYDDQRFVGAVAWRLNHQTFEGFTLFNESINRTSIRYAFVTRVHRVNGANLALATNFANVQVDLDKLGALSGYGYFIDIREADPGSKDRNSSTLGARWEGDVRVGAVDLMWDAQYAYQKDAFDNPTRIREDYLRLITGLDWSWVIIRAAMEQLGGSDADGQFNTVFGTNHKFNGWADKFLTTPTDGVRDLYAKIGGRHGGFSWDATYHDFQAATGGRYYGRELDLDVIYKTPWKQTFAAKSAFYDAGGFSSDTNKFWIWTTYTF